VLDKPSNGLPGLDYAPEELGARMDCEDYFDDGQEQNESLVRARIDYAESAR
jgi:hypothetical protein